MKKGASQILFSVFGLAMLGAGCDLPELPPEPTPQPVQTGEPETILRGTPDVETTERSASFEFTCDAVDGCRYECRLDDQAYFACESPAVFEDLSYGEHQFFVRAIDAQNRTDTTPAVFTWLVTKNGAGSRIDSLETAPQEFNQVTVEFDAAFPAAVLNANSTTKPCFRVNRPSPYNACSVGRTGSKYKRKTSAVLPCPIRMPSIFSSKTTGCMSQRNRSTRAP